MNKKINLIFTGSFSYPSGAAGTQHVQALIDAFNANGHDVRVLSWGKLIGGDSRRGKHRKIPYLMLPPFYEAGGLKVIFSGIKFLRDIKSKSMLNALICYGPTELWNLHLLVAAKLFGFKVVHWIVEDYAAYDLKNIEQGARRGTILAQRFFSRIMRLFSHGVIVLSTQLQRKYQRQKVRTVLVPISTGRLFIRPRSAEAIRRNVIVYAGTLGQKDGVEDLIESFAAICGENPTARLELVGTGTRQRELEKKYAHIPSVIFVGYLDDHQYEKTLSTAHVLCMTRVNTPYANGGFPYKVGDYLATGRPVLATQVSDIGVYLTNKESAMIVASENHAQIADGLEYLLHNPDKADQIGAEGRRICEKYFDPKTNSKMMEEFIYTL